MSATHESLPSIALDDSLESLRSAHRMWTCAFYLGRVGAAVTALSVLAAIPVDVIVTAAGQLTPMTDQHSSLVADLLVRPSDAIYLHDGQRAQLGVDGFNVQEWGVIEGTVRQVASDYTLVDGKPLFQTIVVLDDETLRRPNARARLGAGLRVHARVLVSRARLLDLVRHRETR